MPIDIYARYNNQSGNIDELQRSQIRSEASGRLDCLRETCVGDLHITPLLFSEGFQTGKAEIPAVELRRRLRQIRMVTGSAKHQADNDTFAHIEPLLANCTAFIEYCEAAEAMTGRSCTIVVSN